MPDVGINSTFGQQTWANYILEALQVESALVRGGARFIPITGRVAHVPRLLLDATADWIDEGQEFPTDAPEADTLDLTPRKIGLVCSLSNESVDDAPVSELDLVGRSLTRSVAQAIDNRAFSTGTASSRLPAGLLTAIPAGPAEISPDAITTAVGTVEAVGGIANVVWINPTDLTGLRLLKAGDGSEVPLLEPDVQAGGAQNINGALFVPTPAMPAGTAVVGDAAQVVVAIRRDVVVEFSGDAKFTSDTTVARVKARVDFGINDPRGLVKLVNP
jgi:HK97 family phage major capsid protein